MGNRNLLVTAFLVLTGAAYNVSGPATGARGGSASSSGAKGTEATSNFHQAQKEPWATLSEFLYERQQVGHIPPDPQFLIITIPDPMGTHLSVFFDRTIEAVERAAGDAKYSFDRYWIPWRKNPYDSTDNPETLGKQEAAIQARDSEPGLLLFRGKQWDLVAFLVAETPTSGIESKQFSAALKYITTGRRRGQFLAPKLTLHQKNEVLVLGPAFSGSLPSLSTAVDDHPNVNFKVVSGSTTASVPMKEFTKSVKSSVQFSTTLHSDEIAGCAFLKWIDELPGDMPKLAVLSEGDTAFGASEQFSGCKPTEAIPLYRFPRDIARIRNAYNEEALAPPVPDAYKATRREGVRFSLKDPNEALDSVPTFSRELTPVSQETVLQSLAATLRRDKIRYAAIIATDPLDFLFLARYLTVNAPNVRLFEMDADLLFVRQTETPPLIGLVSVTTYPLLQQKQKQKGTPRDPTPNIFPSRYSEGVYNAALSLLAPEHPRYDYGAPWSERNVPSLWVTAVGRDGYWPLAVVDSVSLELLNGEVVKASKPELEDPSRSYVVVVLALLLAAGLFVFAQFRVWLFPDERWCAGLNLNRTPERNAFMLVCALSLTLIALYFTSPLTLLYPPQFWFPALLSFGLFLLAALAISLHPTSLIRKWNILAIWIFYGALAAGWIVLLESSGKHHEEFFFAYRAVNLASGLSPILPLAALLAGYLSWGRAQWQRNILLKERKQDLPGLKPSLATAARGTIAAFKMACPTVALWIAITASVVAGLLLYTHVRTLERGYYDLAYLIAFCVLLCLYLLVSWQFYWGWTRLELFLNQLDAHPVRFALTDIPCDRALSPVWESNVGRRPHVLMARSVAKLQALASKDQRVLLRAAELEAALERIFRRIALRETESREQDDAMHLAVRIANKLAVDLDRRYWRETCSGGTEPPPGGAEFQTHKIAAQFVAFRFIAFVRYVMLHLRNLMGFLTTAFLLMIFSLNSYPFQSPQVLAMLVLGLFAGLAGLLVWVFLRMHNNPALKRITTNPGDEDKRNFGFGIRLLEAGALPVLAIVATSIPSVGHFLFSWMGPLFDKLQ